MRHLNLQLHPERAPQLDLAQARAAIEALTEDHSIVAGFETSEGDDEGPYVNFTFLAKDLAKLWTRIKSDLLANPHPERDIARASIIICEGKQGWDDYLLLHHYDRTLELDELDGTLSR